MNYLAQLASKQTLTKLNKYQLVAIEGNIGAGSTSLSTMLSRQCDAKLVLEEYVENPFLPKFYVEPERYAFHTEVYFLLDRCKQLKKVQQSLNSDEKLHISDYLFDKSLLYAKVNLSETEYLLFEKMFHEMISFLPKPELIVYLHTTAPQLLKKIQQRGRTFEQEMECAYLQSVEDEYFEYFKTQQDVPILIIHNDNIDFVNNTAHYEQICDWLEKSYEIGVHHLKL
ncbi:MAG: deoxynucleoside kinase [Chitinophagales bacterium]